MAVMQGFRRPVERWGGRGGRGEASERIDEARQWLWARWCSSAAVGAFGEVGYDEEESRGE